MTTSSSGLHLELPCPATDLSELIPALLHIRNNILAHENDYTQFNSIHPVYRKSARNLLHYLAFRLHDIRNLQIKLTDWGLSSLTRPERKVMASFDNLLHVMHALAGIKWTPLNKPELTFEEGRRLLDEHSAALLGEQPNDRRVRIMVTMPAEAATDYLLIQNLLKAGMNCARINCAHDDAPVWEGIIKNIREAEKNLGIECRILMDLSGPKLRTGPIPAGPPVLKVRPKKNEIGEVIAPSTIWLYPEGSKQKLPEASVAIPVPTDWFNLCKKKDRISLTDARGAARRLRIVKIQDTGCWAIAKKTVYFTPGMSLQLKRKGKKVKHGKFRLLIEMPRKPGFILMKVDDLLVLNRNNEPGQPAYFDEKDNFHPATIGCTIPEVLDDVKVGESIWFDDGKIGGVIENIEKTCVHVRIKNAGIEGTKLQAEKGINLPDSALRLKALTGEDIKNLEFIVKYADMIGLSFANRPADVDELLEHIRRIKSADKNDSSDPTLSLPGIVIKVETNQGFNNLPRIIMSAMQTPLCGVMIARGDLAIECGFGRLAELQEEILWICEAAHIPAIWATQVLEGMAKQGLPTRAEVTDAAMGQRAECIMLNKGAHIVDATIALRNILLRMQDHQTKKRSLLRKLSLAEKFFEP